MLSHPVFLVHAVVLLEPTSFFMGKWHRSHLIEESPYFSNTLYRITEKRLISELTGFKVLWFSYIIDFKRVQDCGHLSRVSNVSISTSDVDMRAT